MPNFFSSPRHLHVLETGALLQQREGWAFQCRRLTEHRSRPPPPS